MLPECQTILFKKIHPVCMDICHDKVLVWVDLCFEHFLYSLIFLQGLFLTAGLVECCRIVAKQMQILRLLIQLQKILGTEGFVCCILGIG
ncbi:hypothetical protein D3C81_2047090 [compost metagenome]